MIKWFYERNKDILYLIFKEDSSLLQVIVFDVVVIWSVGIMVLFT